MITLTHLLQLWYWTQIFLLTLMTWNKCQIVSKSALAAINCLHCELLSKNRTIFHVEENTRTNWALLGNGEKWNGHKTKTDFGRMRTTQNVTCFSSLCLTLHCVKASEASVPLGVWEVGVEMKRETAAWGGEEQGIHSRLKLLKFPFATQNRN